MLPPFLWTDICPKGISGIRVKRLCRNRRSRNLRQQTVGRPFFGTSRRMGSIDTLYKKGNVPANKIKQTKAVVWKGEKVNFIALAYTKNEIKDVKCVTSDLKGISSIIPAGNVKSNFVRYTLSDKFKISDEILACAARTPHKTENSHLVPDVLDYIPQMTIPGRTTRPIWITVEIPRDIPSGEYTG